MVRDCTLIGCSFDETSGFIVEIEKHRNQSVSVWLECTSRKPAMPADTIAIGLFDRDGTAIIQVLIRSMLPACHWRLRGTALFAYHD
jgi:hypothetical protein